jgi:rhodanese-related sulfurtransferase
MISDIYAGDLTPIDAWEMLKIESGSNLVDVRTDAEYSFVGVTDILSLSKKTIYVNWLFYPSLDLNPNFTAELEIKNLDKNQPMIFLCRSGVRSKHAAIAMTALGYSKCYNIMGGFEGDKNAAMHRGSENGWKHVGLPWVQE